MTTPETNTPPPRPKPDGRARRERQHLNAVPAVPPVPAPETGRLRAGPPLTEPMTGRQYQHAVAALAALITSWQPRARTTTENQQKAA
jgi:hypothetical protein